VFSQNYQNYPVRGTEKLSGFVHLLAVIRHRGVTRYRGHPWPLATIVGATRQSWSQMKSHDGRSNQDLDVIVFACMVTEKVILYETEINKYGSIRIIYAHCLTGRIPAAAVSTARGVGCLGRTAR
jgi:hypothetical protein